ncbi:MAG: amidohydrolase 2, partial [Gammaproteobacteria bacterium]|nr:amidohydrolase 2 [Gammaproteobacteria bacterium]
HLLYPERLHYDWTAELPALRRRFALQDYLDEARSLGIGPALHMEADVREADIDAETELMEELAKHPSGHLVGAISSCRPESTDSKAFAAFVERATANPLVRGFRRVLHTQLDELASSERFRANLRLLTAQGHPFDLCALPRQLPQAAELASSLQGATFVLDHCGIPAVASGEFEYWRKQISTLATLPNVHCKISGLIAYGDPSRWQGSDVAPVAADLRPYIEEVIHSFGWQRVVWGSDFPVCKLTKGLTAWKQVTDLLTRGASDSELDALAQGNARRIYRLN